MITGGTGFLGHAVCKTLRNDGYTNLLPLDSRQYDLRFTEDASLCMKAFQETKIVAHLGAVVGGINGNRMSPGRFFHDNMIMGLNVIEQARLSCKDLKKFILISTTCAYPRDCPTPFIEENLWNGRPEFTNWGYAESKRALMCMLEMYRLQYGFPGITLIPTNLYGNGDSLNVETNHVIPAIIIKFLKAKRDESPTVELWGDGSPTREFLYVDDCARGIVEAMKYYDKPEPVNLGNGIEISIYDLAHMIKYKIGYAGEIVWNKDMPNGQPRRCLDVHRAFNEFGFTAETSLSEGLDITIEDIKDRLTLQEVVL